MREMLTHYEHIIDQKDQTEKNLSKALDLLYNKTLAYRRYYEWKIIHMEKRQQDYALSLAKRFYEEKIKRVCFEKERRIKFVNFCFAENFILLEEFY